jgi:copper homeostasis protein
VQQATAFNALRVDGIVLGWTRDGHIDEETLARVLAAAPATHATFHRAFDSLDDPESGLRVLQRYPQIDRVLTAAGTGAGTSRCAALQHLARSGRPHIVILPGGSIDEAVLSALAVCDGVTEAHIGRAARIGRVVDGPVSAAAVSALRRAVTSASRS